MRSQRRIGNEITELVGEPLGLEDAHPLHPTAGTDDRVAWADGNVRPCVERACTSLQLADEARLQTAEPILFRFTEVQLAVENLPCRNRQSRESRALDGAVPTHEAG